MSHTETNFSTPSARDALRRVLLSAFTVKDLADLLIPVDVTRDMSFARELFADNDCQVIGVTRKGKFVGWLHIDDSDKDTTCGQAMRDFSTQPIIPDTASMKEVILALAESDPVIVTVMGEKAAAITIRDLQEAPMRMWLFGLITLIEMLITRMIERQLPNERWIPFLTPGRLDYARRLQEERLRRHNIVELHECLQFADKGEILLKYEPSRRLLGFESNRQGQEFFKKIEILRNCLAHAQQLPTEDLSTLLILADSLDSLLNLVEFPAIPTVPTPEETDNSSTDSNSDDDPDEDTVVGDGLPL